MAYEIVENFSAGLDNRKSPIVAPAGTLTRLVNAVINPGGEIEKRRAFVKVADVPNTFGLATTSANLYVFGRNLVPPPPTLTPDGDALAAKGTVLHTQMVPNGDPTLTQTDYDTFDGKIYLATRTGTGDLPTEPTPAQNPHFYDGIETEGSGKGFYVRTYQSKVYAVVGKYMYFSAVGNPMLWDESRLLNAVSVTNLSKGNPAVATVDAADIGKFSNGMTVSISGATGTGLTNANGIHTISSVGTPANTFTLDGVDTSSATAAQTSGVKATPATVATSLSNTNPAVVTVAAADILKFSNGMTVSIAGATGAGVNNMATANGLHTIVNVNNAAHTFVLEGVNTSAGTAPQTTGVTVVQTADIARTGRGYINLSLQDADSETLTSIEVYYDKLAVFSTEATQIWAVDPDPLQNSFTQLLRDTGTSAPRSALQYGSGDVLYLDPSGVRSLKAKDSSNSAAVSDIGSPIDPVVRNLRIAKGDDYMNQAIALLEPSIGRFWLVFPDRILALSYFPGPKITAWSEFTMPQLGGSSVTYAVTCNGKIYLRDSSDRIWVYGGASGEVYNAMGVEVRLPYLSGKKPGHNKLFEAIDVTIQGTWEVRVSYDFNNPEAEEVVGTFSQSTWNAYRAELTGYGSHISLRLYNNDSGFAAVSNLGIHYQVQDDTQ